MEDALTDPRLVVAWLGGIFMGVGLIWILLIEVGKLIHPAATLQSDATWPDVVLYIVKLLPPNELVPMLFIAVGGALAVGAVWNAPAAAGGAATASPTPG